jgi:hypothetical protein
VPAETETLTHDQKMKFSPLQKPRVQPYYNASPVTDGHHQRTVSPVQTKKTATCSFLPQMNKTHGNQDAAAILRIKSLLMAVITLLKPQFSHPQEKKKTESLQPLASLRK